ncbi:hypothetical protein [Paenibacillus sp. FSL K6-2862]|nr:hypothetical protein CHH60_09620 [Paenibacillus sp. 7523-1]PAF31817.1 hypothetical protein CHI14_09185 [Paenibacillus sp. 7516]
MDITDLLPGGNLMSDLEVERHLNMACASSYEDIYPLVIDPFGLNAIDLTSESMTCLGQPLFERREMRV